MDIKACFERLGLPEDTEVSLTYDFLCELQRRWVLSVPYENLDILSGIPISLDPEQLYGKLILRRRGGYCFESNCLLSHILKQLGFRVKDYLARFLRGESGIPVRRHRVLAVTAEGATYICDVGVGQIAPRCPVKLEEGIVQEQCGEKYRFLRHATLGWVLEEYHARDGWRALFAFTEEEQLEIDFIQPSFYCEHHPDSPFNKSVMVAIKTPDGRKTVSGREYKVFRGSELLSLEENLSDARLSEILKTEFGISL